MSEKRFESKVAQSGSRTYIEIPFDPNEVWGKKDKHYVAGSINGCEFRGVLEFDGSQFSLPIGAAWRRDNGVEVGANVEVTLAPEGPQSDTIAPDLAAALNAEPQAKAFFDSLATFYRKNYIRWIEEAKRPETRRNRIAETVRLLKAGIRQR